MRNLFLALVLANLGFAAWHAWFANDAPPTPRARAAPSITLVSELPADAVQPLAARVQAPPDPSPTVTSPPPDPDAFVTAVDEPATLPQADRVEIPTEEPAAVALRCVSIGPFRALAQAAGAASSLRTTGFMPTQRVAEGDVWIGYWVYLQAIPTEREADAILERVRAAGLTDSYVIPQSDRGTLVSLGVFTEINGVTRRRDEVRALGYEPTVVDRTRRATVYWVDVLLGQEQALDLEPLQTPGRILRLELRACPVPSAKSSGSD
jgi:hypothetical protein